MDYRMEIVKTIENKLCGLFTSEQLSVISDTVILTLNDYEVTERCTEIVPLDDTNTRLISRYIGCLVIEGKSQNTIYQYIRTIKKLSDRINKPFPEMGIYDIRMFLAMEKDRKVSNRTLENTRANLSAFFQWMTNEDILDKNPIAKLKPVKYTDEIKKPFSDVEIDALRCACKTAKERALIEMLLSTGIRVSELTAMKTTDVNLIDYSVHVRHGKGAKERMVYTNDLAVKYVSYYLNNRPETGNMLFYNHNHEPLNSGGVRFILNQLAKRANVDNAHPHRMRRTFATNLSKRGMDIHEIQKLMGHSNINTTTAYICLDDTTLRTSYNKYKA